MGLKMVKSWNQYLCEIFEILLKLESFIVIRITEAEVFITHKMFFCA